MENTALMRSRKNLNWVRSAGAPRWHWTTNNEHATPETKLNQHKGIPDVCGKLKQVSHSTSGGMEDLKQSLDFQSSNQKTNYNFSIHALLKD